MKKVTVEGADIYFTTIGLAGGATKTVSIAKGLAEKYKLKTNQHLAIVDFGDGVIAIVPGLNYEKFEQTYEKALQKAVKETFGSYLKELREKLPSATKSK